MRSDLEFASTKTYTHSIGLSCCFRQHRATSHCRFLHGYALEVRLTFTAPNGLDENNWVMDFGGLKPIKSWLEETFDHKLLVAEDDPFKDRLTLLAYPGDSTSHEDHERKQIADIRFVKATGCESFALMIFEHTEQWLSLLKGSVQIESVEVREHQGNSAICRRKSRLPAKFGIELAPNHEMEIVGEMAYIRPVKGTPL